MDQPFACFFRPAAFCRASGPDAAAFLQGQASQDLRPAREGRAVPTLWLSPKGKVQAESWALCQGQEWVLWSADCPADMLLARLQAFLVADEVELADATALWEGAWLRPATPLPFQGLGPELGAWALQDGAWIGRFWHPDAEVLACIFPAAESSIWRARLLDWAGGKLLPAEELLQRRWAAGWYRVPEDWGPGDLPGEADAESWLSHDKGCYTGQEVVARLRSMGSLRRRLRMVEGPGPWPGAPRTLYDGGKAVGSWRAALPSGETAGICRGPAMLPLPAPVHPLSLEPGGPAGVRLLDQNLQ